MQNDMGNVENVIKNRELRVIWHWRSFGYFDFVRCVMCVDQLFGDECRVTPVIHPSNNLAKAVSWSNTDKWQDGNYPCFGPEDRDKLQIYVTELLRGDAEVIYLCGNTKPDLSNVSQYQWLLTPKLDVEKQASEKANQTITGDYYVIHGRWQHQGLDRPMPTDSVIALYEAKIKQVEEEYSNLPIVLICDTMRMREIFQHSFRNMRQPPTVPSFSNDAMTEKNIVDFFTDIKLIGGAKEITSVCNFHHGSTGFAKITSAVFDKPYRNVNPGGR